ncbi:MAG: hypothetical protein E6H57_09940 [Betaproteobacteria bacterium]|nr:MAG: hypothetical protein E6H57_09940 [Betaproteobacteria bacterium]
MPFEYVGRMLTSAGYVVLVPERRGYGKSDGAIWWHDVGNDSSQLVARLQAETDDVLAALGYLQRSGSPIPSAWPSWAGHSVASSPCSLPAAAAPSAPPSTRPAPR